MDETAREVVDLRHRNAELRNQVEELTARLKSARRALEALESGSAMGAICGHLDSLNGLYERMVSEVGAINDRLDSQGSFIRMLAEGNDIIRELSDHKVRLSRMRRLLGIAQDRLAAYGLEPVQYGDEDE